MKSFHDPNKMVREPSADLMDRLAHGKKAQVKYIFKIKLDN